ncbi:hypothetical protein [Terasakiella pusilla]|uniref:hypothetical protein n=1 Tax=Terasakiella pusilla TaxID=64973 RepID=UPI003AA8FADA
MDVMVNGITVSVDLKASDLRKSQQQSKAQGTDFAALLQQQKEVKSEILEKGFKKYVGDMQQEKLEEEIRNKILQALGLSEEQYMQLPAEQRASIEQAVQEAMQKEMQARAEQEQTKNGNKLAVSVPLVAATSG